MKKIILAATLIIALFITTSSNAQVGIGVSTADRNPSAQLDVVSTTKGFLPPRMTEAQRNLIVVTSASAGLTIWCTNCGDRGELQVYDGLTWTNMVGAAATSSTDLTPLVTIGAQVWATQNLNVSTYRDGTAIPKIENPLTWPTLTIGAYCYYDNDSASYAAVYGKLYNWYAVAGIWDAASLSNPSLRKNLAPAGYHIPSDSMWTTLTDYLGGLSVAGGKMKEIGTTHWITPNTGADNSSGFAGLPGGYCFEGAVEAQFQFNRFSGYWWSSTESSTYPWCRYLNHNSSTVTRSRNITYSYKTNGLSVRCLKD
jgi:uncharacterized protein (TIGR02145 family)